MAMLNAAQVAAIGGRKAGYPPTVAGVQGYADSLVADVAVLVAQDEGWRELVEELLEYVRHDWPCHTESARDQEVCTCGLEGFVAQARDGSA